MNSKAPIVLFTYNREWHTRQTVQALQKNFGSDNCDLIIFSDGPKSEQDKKNVEQVRNFLYSINGFKSIRIISNEINLGLARSIISGVSSVVEEYGKIIVLEDDMITSPFFLNFMNDGLDLYYQYEQVACIHGYRYPIGNIRKPFFMRGADCWGWATWKRAWHNFNEDGNYLLKELKIRNLSRAFNHNNSFPYMAMLQDQIAGKNNSWAIRWKASAFLNDQYTLYYKESLVRNIGNDNSGTHSKTTTQFDVELASNYEGLQLQTIEEDKEIAGKISGYYRSINPTLWQRISAKIFQ